MAALLKFAKQVVKLLDAEDEAIIDPKKFMGPGRNAVIDLCCHKIKLCGSDGKA